VPLFQVSRQLSTIITNLIQHLRNSQTVLIGPMFANIANHRLNHGLLYQRIRLVQQSLLPCRPLPHLHSDGLGHVFSGLTSSANFLRLELVYLSYGLLVDGVDRFAVFGEFDGISAACFALWLYDRGIL